jgi:hypothetical protein
MSKKRVSTRHVGSFAEEVDKLVLQLLAGSASSERHGVDVRKVAVGLTVIRQALDIQLEKLSPEERVETGIIWAYDLLDGLMSGKNFAIWRYIEDVQSARRPHKASASEFGSLRRIAVVAFIRAHERVGQKKSRRAAAQDIVDACGSDDFALTVETVLGWYKKLEKDHQKRRDAVLAVLAQNDLHSAEGAGIDQVVDNHPNVL